MKTYSVKEIRELTGLTWKQLYEYKDGVPGIGPKNEAGYKQYSEEDMKKLVQATLFAKLGEKPKHINDMLSEENYDKNVVLQKIKEDAEKKLIEVQDIITVADLFLQLPDDPILMNPYAIKDLHEVAEKIRASENDIDVKAMNSYLSSGGYEKILGRIEELGDVDENNIEDAYDSIYSFVSSFKNEINIDLNRFLNLLTIGLYADSTFKSSIDSRLGKGKVEKTLMCIGYFMFKGFYEESEDDIDHLCDLVEMDYKEPEVRDCIGRFQASFMKNFGLKTQAECISNIKSLRYTSIINGDLEDEDSNLFIRVCDYVAEGIAYYSDESEL